MRNSIPLDECHFTSLAKGQFIMSKRRVAKNDYTVGWVCALSLEMAAAKCVLEETHEDLEEQDTSDHNISDGGTER